MSRFTRAFEAALKRSKLHKLQSAKAAGFHASLLSRVLNGRSPQTPEHIEKLVATLPNLDDRDECVREFLIDCAPESYRERLTVEIGDANGQTGRQSGDKLGAEILALEHLATEQPDLRRLITLLLSILSKPDHQRAAGHTGAAHGRHVIGALLHSAGQHAPAIPPLEKPVAEGSDAAKPS